MTPADDPEQSETYHWEVNASAQAWAGPDSAEGDSTFAPIPFGTDGESGTVDAGWMSIAGTSMTGTYSANATSHNGGNAEAFFLFDGGSPLTIIGTASFTTTGTLSGTVDIGPIAFLNHTMGVKVTDTSGWLEIQAEFDAFYDTIYFWH